jgi:lysophospholipase L1-like esterase
VAKVTRSISIYGDSISTFEEAIPNGNRLFYDKQTAASAGIDNVSQTWWTQIINHLDGTLCANASFSGCMVEGAGFPAGQSIIRAKQVISAQGNVPSDIFIFMGINDYGWGSADAQAKGRSAATPTCLDLNLIPERIASQAPKDAALKFSKAYSEMLSNLHQVAPTASIWCINLVPAYIKNQPEFEFCFSLRGIKLDAYNQAIGEAVKDAQKQNINATLLDIASFDLAYESIDGTHPTKLGMQQLSNLIKAALCNDVEIDKLTDKFGKPANHHCDKSSCIGCAYARDHGNTWSCVCERKAAQS